MSYRVEYYGPDGCAEDSYTVATCLPTLKDARAMVRGELGLNRLDRRRRWHSGEPGEVESWHEYPESQQGAYGCGGCTIAIEEDV